MGYHPHVQSKHIIKYNKTVDNVLNFKDSVIGEWLRDQGVLEDYSSLYDNSEWEIDKELLEENITEESYKALPKELRKAAKALVEQCLAAKTGHTAYVDWF